MAYENELIMKAIANLIDTELVDALDDVESYWQDRDDSLALPGPINVHEGYKQTVLEMPSTDFPFISVLVPNRDPVRGEASRWGQEDVVVTAGLHIFVIADDETIVSKLAHRYAQALVNVFQTHPEIAGHSQRHYEPSVHVGVTERHAKSGVEGDLFDPDKTDFIRIVEIQMELVGG